jgi:hypothetical protein
MAHDAYDAWRQSHPEFDPYEPEEALVNAVHSPRVIGLAGSRHTTRVEGGYLLVRWSGEGDEVRYRPLAHGEAPLNWESVHHYGHIWVAVTPRGEPPYSTSTYLPPQRSHDHDMVNA